jgi:dTDP-glucose 4,6-dehydratase/UDP-glucose 4-epimerase
MLNVVDAAVAAGVGELYVASSSEVYQSPPRIPTDEDVPLSIPDPRNPRYSYAGSKIISELLALHVAGRSIGRVVIFRPHNAYGPDMGWEHVIPQLAVRIRELARASQGELRVPIQGDGTETRAFAYIDDIVEGVLAALDRPPSRQGASAGKPASTEKSRADLSAEALSGEGGEGGAHRLYNLGNNRSEELLEFIATIEAALGKKAIIEPAPMQPGDVPATEADVDDLIRDVGFKPATPVEEGISRFVDWYREFYKV